MDGIHFAAAVLVVIGTGVAPVAGAPALTTGAARGRAATGGLPFLAAPVMWMLGTLGVPVEEPAPLPNSVALERGRDQGTIEFEVDDDGLGVYLEVAGRVEFERAEIRLADGSLRRLALGHAVRGRGLYELCVFDGPTRVRTVRLHARASSPAARVGVRLGR